MLNFASDNESPVHPKVMASLQKANEGFVKSYGEDEITAKVREQLQTLFGPEAKSFLSFNGTGGNIIGLQALAKPYSAIYCSAEAHTLLDECGAVGKHAGAQLIGIPCKNGKIDPEQLEQTIRSGRGIHSTKPGVLSIAQTTERGTTYSREELNILISIARENGLKVHMDGARLANAAAFMGTRDLKAITADQGVDVLTFGGTKNGLMMGEAVVLISPEAAEDFAFVHKQGLQLASKNRYMAAQFEAYLDQDLWYENAQTANRMAQRLWNGLSKISAVELSVPLEGNCLFVKWNQEIHNRLKGNVRYHYWTPEIFEARLVTSFCTSEAMVDEMIALVSDAAV
ncbi:threonine aldolase family protein [Kiloniella sp. b19]|uniref:threonine aldolase family protein n=1 Tax=Kiloniella sp. GXU_MW_B19 TaxID=3141326 RepID=UPI0031D1EE1C